MNIASLSVILISLGLLIWIMFILSLFYKGRKIFDRIIKYREGRIETRLTSIEGRLDKIESRLGKVEKDIHKMKGKARAR